MSLSARLGPAPGDAAFAGFTAASLGAAVLVAVFDFVPILDHINLAFHEFGHLLFGLFGELMHWLGGTLAQFIFPIATTLHFLRRQQVLSAAACLYWLFENLRYVALYLADARTQQLPLVGGGEHDWAYLLGRWGLLEQDTSIAGFLRFISWSGWFAVWAIVAWLWWQGRQAGKQQQTAAERARIIAEARERARRPPRA